MSSRVIQPDDGKSAPLLILREVGVAAVKAADELERLREGRLDLGTATSQVLGAHSFYLVDGSWVRDDHEAGTKAPEVVVGSPAFTALLAEAPEIADAAALGERVVTEGPSGWVTLVWPDAQD